MGVTDSKPNTLMHASELVRHPTVYIYNTTPWASQLSQIFSAGAKNKQLLTEWAFGRQLSTRRGKLTLFRSTDTWAASKMLLYRLIHQEPQRQTRDPAVADLFIIPLTVEVPEFAPAVMDQTHGSLVDAACDHLLHSDLQLAYPHLTRATANRHLVVAAGHTILIEHCVANKNGELYLRPPSVELLERMRWYTHDQQSLYDNAWPTAASFAPGGHFSTALIPGAALAGGMTQTTPFPSGAVTSVAGLHALRALPSPRKVTLAFIGSVRGSGSRRAVRAALSTQCRRHGAPDCVMLPLQQDRGISDIEVAAFHLKQSSTFCAEPSGDNELRRGLADALLCGCIPVVFLDDAQLRRLWPMHMHGWRRDAIVVLQPSLVANNRGIDGIDVVRYLKSLPAHRVERMRSTILRNAHRIAYLSDLNRTGDDAIDVALKGFAFGLPG